MIGTMMEKAARVRAVNEANGWFEADRTFAEGIALLHSEVSEALEAYREHGLDDYTVVKSNPADTYPRDVVEILVRSGFEFQTDESFNQDNSLWRLIGWTSPTSTEPWTPEEKMTLAKAGIAKPEGVGSELADVLIRLLDESDRQGIDLDAAMAEHVGPPRYAMTGLPFGSYVAWMHWAISKLYSGQERKEWVMSYVTYIVIAVAKAHGVDLEWEFERKLAFNATRGHKHGGKRL